MVILFDIVMIRLNEETVCSSLTGQETVHLILNKMYLTGTVDRWNSAKRCELHDRVNHVG